VDPANSSLVCIGFQSPESIAKLTKSVSVTVLAGLVKV
jgi:hypothetical protein